MHSSIMKISTVFDQGIKFFVLSDRLIIQLGLAPEVNPMCGSRAHSASYIWVSCPKCILRLGVVPKVNLTSGSCAQSESFMGCRIQVNLLVITTKVFWLSQPK
jgi:hypothetical protein